MISRDREGKKINFIYIYIYTHIFYIYKYMKKTKDKFIYTMLIFNIFCY